MSVDAATVRRIAHLARIAAVGSIADLAHLMAETGYAAPIGIGRPGISTFQ